MDQTPLLVPDILTEKGDRIAFLQVVDARRQFDVVLDQDCLTRRKSNDEPLVRTARPVIGEYACDETFSLDLNIPLMMLKRISERIRLLRGDAARGTPGGKNEQHGDPAVRLRHRMRYHFPFT